MSHNPTYRVLTTALIGVGAGFAAALLDQPEIAAVVILAALGIAGFGWLRNKEVARRLARYPGAASAGVVVGYLLGMGLGLLG